jgi:hypothetical protein
MNRWLIVVGVLLVVVGLVWPWLTKLGLFHLPGDIVIERENFRFYFPIITMIILSVVISVIMWFLRR